MFLFYHLATLAVKADVKNIAKPLRHRIVIVEIFIEENDKILIVTGKKYFWLFDELTLRTNELRVFLAIIDTHTLFSARTGYIREEKRNVY